MSALGSNVGPSSNATVPSAIYFVLISRVGLFGCSPHCSSTIFGSAWIGTEPPKRSVRRGIGARCGHLDAHQLRFRRATNVFQASLVFIRHAPSAVQTTS